MEEKVGFVYQRHTGSLLSSSKNLPDNVKRALRKYFKKSLGCKSNKHQDTAQNYYSDCTQQYLDSAAQAQYSLFYF